MRRVEKVFVAGLMALMLVSILVVSIPAVFAGDYPSKGVDYLHQGVADIENEPEFKFLWKANVVGTYDEFSGPIVVGNKVYIGNLSDNIFRSLDLKTGSTIWTYQLNAGVSEAPVWWDNKVYVETGTKTSGSVASLYCFRDNGENLWKYDGYNNNYWVSAPWINVDNRIVYWIDGRYLRALNADNGSLIKSVDVGAGSHPVIGAYFKSPADGIGRVYVPVGGVKCYKADNLDNLLWSVSGKVWDSGVSVDNSRSDNVVIFVGFYDDANVLCIDAENGTIYWNKLISSGANAFIFSVPAVWENKVYAGGRDSSSPYGTMTFLWRDNGEFVWRDESCGEVYSSPTVLPISGRVVYASRDGYLYVRDARTGVLVWQYLIETSLCGHIAVVDNYMLTSSDSGYVWCFGSGGNASPNPPTSLLCEGLANPTHVIDLQPEFSAIGTDNDHDNMDYYALQIDNDSDFSSVFWDNTKTPIPTFDNGERCSDISYAGSALTRGTTYYWRIKFWDNNANNEGAWSTETATFKINQLPTAPTTLTLNSPKVGETLMATGSGSTDTDEDNIENYYLFYNENHSAIRQNWSTTKTYTILATDNHDNIRVFVKVYDGYENSADNKENSIIVANTIPTAPTNLTLNPPKKVGETLTATGSGSTDADGDGITYYYRFYNQTHGVERQAYSTTNTYTIVVADAHDNIRIFTKAYDGYEYSGEIENSIIVSNSLPVAGLVSPENGATGTSITPLLDWTFADNDNDAQTKYWVLVDNDSDFSSPKENTGEVTSGTTSYAITTPLAYSTKYYWKVNVYDGYEWADWYGVWNFTTGTEPNYAPNKPTNLSPSIRQTTENVIISCVVVDNDVNNINVFFYDNSDNSLIDNIWIVSGGTATRTWGGLTRGLTYVFFTRGQDNNGAWGENSGTQSFYINQLPTVSPAITPISPLTTDNLVCAPNGSDLDGDNLTYTYKWFENGVLIGGQTTNILNSSYTAADYVYVCEVTPHDGYEYGIADNSGGSLIGNSTPTAPTSWTDLGMNLTNHTPPISWTKGTDADGDTVTTYIYVGTTSTPTTEENYTTGTTANLGTTVILSDGVTYYYRLRSWDGKVFSGYTAADIFRMNTPPTCSITNPPTGFTAVVNAGIPFTRTSSDAEGDAISFLWSFGDGVGTSTSATPSYQYNTTGTYTVTLVVNDGFENSTLASIVVNVTGEGAPPSGPSGGPSGGWIEQAKVAVEAVVQPPGTVNILFLPFLYLQVWMWLAVIGTLAWWKDQKGIVISCGLLFAFLLVMGARIL